MSWKIGVLLASFGVRSAVGGRSQIFALVMTSREEFPSCRPNQLAARPLSTHLLFPVRPSPNRPLAHNSPTTHETVCSSTLTHICHRTSHP